MYSLAGVSGIISAVIVTYILFGGNSKSYSKKKKKRRDVGVVGLPNIGNSCFLNAVVQGLASCPTFCNWISQSSKLSSTNRLLSSLDKLLGVVNREEGTINDDQCTNEIFASLRSHGWVISTEEQDAHELFHALASTLDDEILSLNNVSSLLDVSWFSSKSTRAESSSHCSIISSPITGLSINEGFSKFVEKNDYILSHEKDFHINKEDKVKQENFNEINNIITNGEILYKDSPTINDISQNNDYLYATDNNNITNKDVTLDYNHRDLLHDNNTTECTNFNVNSNKKIVPKINGSEIMPLNTGKPKSFSNLSLPYIPSPSSDELCNTKSKSPFKGYFADFLQCKQCFKKSPRQWSSFESMSLYLPSEVFSEISLTKLLDNYISQEEVHDVKCDSCSKKAGKPVNTTFYKQHSIGKLPQCLCFHIQRTVWQTDGLLRKRYDNVFFPVYINMEPYTYTKSLSNLSPPGLRGGSRDSCNYTKNSEFLHSLSLCNTMPSSEHAESPNSRSWKEAQSVPLYKLQSVIVHVGDVGGGHYITYRRCPSDTGDKWFYCSDLHVKEVPFSNVKQANAYMIIYERVQA